MPRRSVLFAPVMIAVAFAITIPTQIRLNRARIPEQTEELRYLPSERLLSHFTAGMSSVIADLLWIQCLQYTGRHYRGDRDFTWLNHMLTMVTRLDPYFVPAYRYGAIFLSMLKAQDDAGLELLDHGMVLNPDAWELPYEAAMTWLLNRRDHPQAEIRASQYLAMAVETGNAPAFVAETAAALQASHNLEDLERAMWENTRKTGNEMMRDLAQRKLLELDLRVACKSLTETVAAYEKQNGQRPKSLNDLLINRLVTQIPEDPFGGTFFIDAGGTVLNTTLLSAQQDRLARMLTMAAEQFKAKFGYYPQNLDELVSAKILDHVPPHPYPGRSWVYLNGMVSSSRF